MTQPSVQIRALKANAPEAAKAELQFLVAISSPPIDPGAAPPRPRINLSLALDRSGSMSGHPLEQAKLCAERVVDSLQEGDRFALAAYANEVSIVVPPAQVTDKASIKRAIRGIHTGGMTALHAGWLAAAEAAATGLAPDVLTRVCLLSDGNANVGIKDASVIAAQAAALAAKGIMTSSVGLGPSFNEHLMSTLAESGQGQASYGETADDLWPSFEAELGLLSATCGKSVRLHLHAPCGGKVSVLNGFQVTADGSWILPNLVHGAETGVLVKVEVDGLPPGEVLVLEARVAYDDIKGVPAAALEARLVQKTVPFADFVIGLPEPAVAEKVKEHEAALLQVAAQEAASHGNFAAVHDISRKMADMAGGNAWIGGMAERMGVLAAQGDRVLLSKEAVYASTSLRTSYTSSAPGMGEEASFLKRRTRQGKAD